MTLLYDVILSWLDRHHTYGESMFFFLTFQIINSSCLILRIEDALLIQFFYSLLW